MKSRATVLAAAVVAAFALALWHRAALGQAEPASSSPDEPPDEDDLAAVASASASATSTPNPPPAPAAEPMMRVGGGSFRMGSTAPRAQPNETPMHLVKVSPFLLDTTEVTVAAYRACVARGACVAPRATSSQCTFDRGAPERPVNCVTFAEAESFCLALGKRLPTEAEWELAARGTGVERAYPWGDDPPTCERAVSMRGEKTAESCASDGPVAVDARRGRSPYGVADLAGNLEEWVGDFYDDRYPSENGGAVTDPRGPAVGTAHVLRGGGWQSPRSGIRTTARSWASAAERGANVGFRCARAER